MSRETRVLAAYGAGGFGREVLELGELINETGSQKWGKFIFIDDAEDVPKELCGYHVYKYEDAKNVFNENLDVIISVGEPKTREVLFNKISSDNIHMPILINPTSFVSKNAEIGAGTVVRYGSSIFSEAIIGKNVCINPHSNIGHNVTIEEGSMISAFSNIAGGVNIGRYAYISMNACVKELTSIGSRSVISMGSIICKDIPDFALAAGNPLRIVKINDSFRVFKYSKNTNEGRK